MNRIKGSVFAAVMSLLAIVWSVGVASAASIGHFVHDYGSVTITLDVYDGQPGGRYLWQYTVENHTFDPTPGTSNGFSGFELYLPSSIPEIADVTPNAASAIPWEVNCCSGQPVEWDREDSAGNGIMPGESGIFSFTTNPRQIAINNNGWFHSWQSGQTEIMPTLGMHVPLVPGLTPVEPLVVDVPAMSDTGLAALAVLLGLLALIAVRRRLTS